MKVFTLRQSNVAYNIWETLLTITATEKIQDPLRAFRLKNSFSLQYRYVLVRSKGIHIPDERRILSAYVTFNIYATLLYNFLS